MAYVRPTVKDRVATGDDKFLQTSLGGNRIQLTPDPDSVTEAGTDLNKAFFDNIFDGIDERKVPSTDIATDKASDNKATTPKAVYSYLVASIVVTNNADNTVSLTINFQ